MNKLISTLAIALIISLNGGVVNADEIGLGAGTGGMEFGPNGSGGLDVSSPAGIVIAAPLATFQSPTGTVVDSGSASFSSFLGATTGPESGGVFMFTSISPVTFQYTGAVDSLTGTVTWAGIKDNGTTPEFDVGSTLLVTSSTGDPTFLADFPVGSLAEIDITISLEDSLSYVAAQPYEFVEDDEFSSGKIVPNTSSVPEPNMLIPLAVAMLGLVWLRFKSVI
jgi:hypothetical protein